MHTQYRYNQCRSNYIVHIGNNMSFLKNFFLYMVGSGDAEPVIQRTDCTYLIFFIYSPVSGHLDYVHCLANVESAAVIMGVLIFLWNHNEMSHHPRQYGCHEKQQHKDVDAEKLRVLHTVGRNAKLYRHYKRNMGVSQRNKNRPTIWLSNLTSLSLLMMYFNWIWINNQGYWHIERFQQHEWE